MSNVKREKSDSISTSSPSDAAASSFLHSLSVACPKRLIIAATYYRRKPTQRKREINGKQVNPNNDKTFFQDPNQGSPKGEADPKYQNII